MTAAFGQGPDTLRDAAAAFEKGDTAAAIRLYREFLNVNPYAAEVRSNLGAALVRAGQVEQAVTEYRAALVHLPMSTRVRMNLALAYYKLGRFADAGGELETILQQNPLDTQAALLLGECLMQFGRPDRAVEVLQPLREEFPGDRAVTYLLGAALLRVNRTREAQAVLEGLVKGGESAETELLLGQTEYQRQNLLPAAAHLKKAVELNPNLPGAHSLYGQVLRSVARLDEATEQFRLELKVNSFDYVANTEIAMLLKQEGKLADALAHLARALQARPGDPGVRHQQALIYTTQGKFEDARKELESLTKEVPEFAEAHAALATVYYRLKRPADGDRARAAARKAMEAAAQKKE